MPKRFLYGYYFYQTDIPLGDKTYNTSFAWGGYGQYFVTVEELDLGIVITAHEKDDTIMTQVANRILPAFSK